MCSTFYKLQEAGRPPGIRSVQAGRGLVNVGANCQAGGLCLADVEEQCGRAGQEYRKGASEFRRENEVSKRRHKPVPV